VREIILDTETTGIDFKKGHRLIEIGCIEIVNRIPTGREYHCFIDPERDVPEDAVAIHGITSEYLKGKPLFQAIAREFFDFIADDTLVIHNATFDIGFLNFELGRCGLPLLSFDRVVDTLALARRKHPAGPNNLDALCRRYGIDNSKRTKHGALMDSLLLAEIYVELLGERQAAFGLGGTGSTAGGAGTGQRSSGRGKARTRPSPLPERLTQADLAAHRAYVEKLGDKAIRLKFWKDPPG
jgi:DNA polymerase III subunit epsilon